MFNNHDGLRAADRAQTQGGQAVQKYGTLIWDMVCYCASTEDGKFTTSTLVHMIACEGSFTKSTAQGYWNAFHAYHQAALHEFNGPWSHIKHLSRGKWQLIDGANMDDSTTVD